MHKPIGGEHHRGEQDMALAVCNQDITTARPETPSQVITPGGRPLRICFILEPLHAGVGRHVVDAARGLGDRGHDVHVIYSPVRLDRSFLADLARHPSIHCHPIKIMPGLNASDVSAFWRIKACVKANGPFDVIHGQSSKGGGFARLLKLFGAPAVLYTPHAFVTFSPRLSTKKKQAFRLIELALSRLTDKVICSSQGEHDHAVGLGISPQKLTTIVNARAPAECRDREDIRAELGLTPEKVVIGFVGRLETQKAPHRLIEACVRVLPKVPELHLLMIGDGPERDKLETCMRAEKLEHHATWLGAVDGVQYMPAMDMLAISSIYEGFAYVLLEALNAGLPIVATPVGGVRESIKPGQNGIIVDHHPVESLAAALHLLACDADLRRAMGQTSREHAENFSLPRMIDALEGLYYRSVKISTQPAPKSRAEFPKPATTISPV